MAKKQKDTPKPVIHVEDDETMDISKEVNLIWSVANILRGDFGADDYKNIIIPMVIVRRFECVLENTKDAVVKKYKEDPGYPEKGLCRISGYNFYNTSEFTLTKLLDESKNIAKNFKDYIDGFSKNIKGILADLNLYTFIDSLDKKGILFTVVERFSEIDLSSSSIDGMRMGYIFEELIRRFSENINAGQHYTGRDIIKAMVDIILAENCDDIFDDRKVITILDQAAGTGGMLHTAARCIQKHCTTADVRLFSQEKMDNSYAMCKAEMLILGQNVDNIRKADTLLEDCFPDMKMRFVLENPPFGQPWNSNKSDKKEERNKIIKEAEKGASGRYPGGLPATSDSLMLFIQSAINKLDPVKGRAVIIINGSPLFSGGTSSGESQIRRYLLENDYIEAIIQLKNDMFYNTGISTYMLVLSMNKQERRRGKLRLIDASHLAHPLRKSLGNKRFEITKEDRLAITKLYADFKENEHCKIFNNSDFIYKEYAVMQPLQRNYEITEERIESMLSNGTLNTLYDPNQVEELKLKGRRDDKSKAKLDGFIKNKPIYDAILKELHSHISDEVFKSPHTFRPHLNQVLAKATKDKKLIDKIMVGLSKMDKTAEIHTDKNGIVYDKDTKDSEIVPINMDIEDYMEKEVYPYIPDAKAFFEEDLSKKKPVIKTGAEIPFNKHFYSFIPPKPASELASILRELENKVHLLMEDLLGGE